MTIEDLKTTLKKANINYLAVDKNLRTNTNISFYPTLFNEKIYDINANGLWVCADNVQYDKDLNSVFFTLDGKTVARLFAN